MDHYFNKKAEIKKCNSKKIHLTYRELLEINNKKLWKTPLCQTNLDQDRTEAIEKTWIDMPHFVLTERPLCVAFVEIDDCIEYFLIDGQHKLTTAIQLYEKDNSNNNYLECAFIECKTQEDIDKLFDLVNIDSAKSKLYIESNIFEKRLIHDLKNFISKEYNKSYATKKSTKNNIMTIEEFIDELIYLKAFSGWDGGVPSCEKIMNDLKICDANFWDNMKYSELKIRCDVDNIFCKDEQNVLNNDNNTCLFFKHNNFRLYFSKYIENKDMDPYHEYRSIREKITQTMRKDVWKSKFKNQKIGTCSVYGCNNTIEFEKNYYVCGHIISVKHGGSTDLDNLLPMCTNCNLKMGAINLDEYEKNIIFNKQNSKCKKCKKKKNIELMVRIENELCCDKCYEQMQESSDDSSIDSDECAKPKKVIKKHIVKSKKKCL